MWRIGKSVKGKDNDMKKSLFLAGLAVISASVCGMNLDSSGGVSGDGNNKRSFSQLKDGSEESQAKRSRIVENKEHCNFFKKGGRTIRAYAKVFLKILDLEKKAAVTKPLELPYDELQLNLFRLLSPRTIRYIYSDIDGNSSQKKGMTENDIELLQSVLSKEGFKLSTDLVKTLSSDTAKSIVQDIQLEQSKKKGKKQEVSLYFKEVSLNTFDKVGSILSAIIKETDLVDSGNVLRLLFFYKNRTQISSADLEEMWNRQKNSVFGEVRDFCEHLAESSLFSYAYTRGNANIVKYMLKHGADINKSNGGSKWPSTPLFWACENGNLDLVKYLVKHGANVNKQSEFTTPLFWACRSGNLDLAV